MSVKNSNNQCQILSHSGTTLSLTHEMVKAEEKRVPPTASHLEVVCRKLQHVPQNITDDLGLSL